MACSFSASLRGVSPWSGLLTGFGCANPLADFRAEPGVQPKGPEQSHGTEQIQYARRSGSADPKSNSAAPSNMPDWLWDNFTTYDRMAPGRADGTFGQEVIG